MNGAALLSDAPLEQYLRRVTCLLPPAAAQAVQAELRGNLYQTMLDAQSRGLPEPQAWAAALQTAGPAWPAALKFAQVYTLPWLLRWMMAGVALGGAAYAVQNSSHGQPLSPATHEGRP